VRGPGAHVVPGPRRVCVEDGGKTPDDGLTDRLHSCKGGGDGGAHRGGSGTALPAGV